ncbi:hypothetical protein BDQ94DRAFT_151182 [Aspergillus welwitschiae]|uniref:Uncharacterized protein n=1 Tax=Aspergillus welwitschiae TaxID=1341132 RepID=A0A3F3PPZ0_9EURO|nr:hypothetical protein BDQ94DRAFT_151182 [Aspergillus welwitschiae]RDH28997.1 hypothetical protein BDQ94DRAFT_151182 [Aspergillus welwitschiae]
MRMNSRIDRSNPHKDGIWLAVCVPSGIVLLLVEYTVLNKLPATLHHILSRTIGTYICSLRNIYNSVPSTL